MSFLMSGTYKKWVDNFEHNDLTGYYSGSTGSFNIQSSNVYEGTYALEATANAIIESRPGDGLDHYPEPGDYWKVRVYTGGTESRPAVAWCAQDTGDPNGTEPCYYLSVDNTNQNLNLWTYDGSNYNRHLRSYYGEDLSNQWLTVYLEHQDDDTHYTELMDGDESTTYTSGSGTPATIYESGAVKFWSRGNGNQYFDGMEITN